MQPVAAVAIFCEDIREEKSGQDIIIGVLPDNLQTGSGQAAGTAVFAKLGLYLRVHLDAHAPQPKSLTVRLVLSDGAIMPLQAWAPEVVEKAFLDARATGMPLVGLVLKIVAAPLAIRMAGKIVAIVNVNDSDYVAGALNVIVLDPSAPRA
jgi:hypothetical protein